jgi:hypothetical protein
MALEAMIVSHDWQEVSVLECILNSLHVGVIIQPDVDCARAQLEKSKLDALIVDRDLSGTETLLDLAPQNNSVPLLLLSRSADGANLSTSGATYFFEKPVSVEQAVRTLSATRNMMLGSRLRYHRHTLDIPVSLSFGKRKRVTAQLTNLSHGGVAIRATQPLDPNGTINLRFKIPGVNCSVQAKGELAWADLCGHAGIRFLEMPCQLQRRMQLWLENRYFTN